MLKKIDNVTEVELDESKVIRFYYKDFYWLHVNETDLKTAELSTHYSADIKDNDEKIKALYLLNQINQRFIMAKLYYDEETREITAKVDLYVTGIISANNGFVFNDKEQFTGQLSEALTAIQSATEDFFEELRGDFAADFL